MISTNGLELYYEMEICNSLINSSVPEVHPNFQMQMISLSEHKFWTDPYIIPHKEANSLAKMCQ
jgi:hypothetical protein